MRIQTLQQLKKSALGSISIVGIVSKNPLEREAALKILLKGQNFVTYSSDASSSQLLGELQPSLLTTRPVVVVQKAQTLSKATQTDLKTYCKTPFPSSCLILVGESLPPTLANTIEASGILLTFPAPKPWEKEEALAKQLTSKRIPFVVAKEVVRRMNGDGLLAAQEIEKLQLYAHDRVATVADIEAIVVSDPMENVWQLGDAVMQGQIGRALTIFHALLDNGEAFIGILALLRSQLRDACLAAELSQEALAKALPKLRPRRIEQLSHFARTWGKERCQRALLLIHQTDLDARNSVADSKTLADCLIIRMVQ